MGGYTVIPWRVKVTSGRKKYIDNSLRFVNTLDIRPVEV